MKIKIFGGLLMAALAVTSIAKAQTRTPGIDHQRLTEQRRIRAGIRNGELTPYETRRLRAAERRLAMDERIAKADGRVTPAERRHLRREERWISNEIYREKHNRQVRY